MGSTESVVVHYKERFTIPVDAHAHTNTETHRVMYKVIHTHARTQTHTLTHAHSLTFICDSFEL